MQHYEVPYRVEEYKQELQKIINTSKSAMKKTQGEHWRALDRINRIASKQLIMMRTPLYHTKEQ